MNNNREGTYLFDDLYNYVRLNLKDFIRENKVNIDYTLCEETKDGIIVHLYELITNSINLKGDMTNLIKQKGNIVFGFMYTDEFKNYINTKLKCN